MALMKARKCNSRFLGSMVNESQAPLPAIQHFINLAGMLGLRPKHVSRVTGGFPEPAGGMAVKNGAAKSDAAVRVAIRSKRQMPSGNNELKLVASGRAENRDTLIGAPRTSPGVIPELLEELRVPIGVYDALEYFVNQRLLRVGEKAAANGPLGDLPMVGNE